VHPFKFGDQLLLWQKFGQLGKGVPLMHLQHRHFILRSQLRPLRIGDPPVLLFDDMIEMAV
jgi:hypothetical protein